MILPVIKGKIGNWTYYSGLMSFKQISDNVTTSIGELYQAQCLGELLQRDLTENCVEIKDYILQDNERFFNAIILAIYDGDPQWLEIEFEDQANNNVGFLQFTGKEVIFPVDGQHRVSGIKAALLENAELQNDTVPVIFIAHSQSSEGRTRTRKLFSTLNRRAKPVGQNENIALDEDDVCSIITRELLQEYPLLSKENVVNSKSKQIPNNNKVALTSLIALYQSVCTIVQRYLKMSSKKFQHYLLYRPSQETIQEISAYVHNIFDSFVENTSVLQGYLSDYSEDKAVKYRNKNGGNILFRPIVFTDYFAVAFILSEKNDAGISGAFKRLNTIPQDLQSAPWLGLLWDGNKIINRISHTMIKNILLWMADSRCLSKNEMESLEDSFAKALTTSNENAKELLAKVKDVT